MGDVEDEADPGGPGQQQLGPPHLPPGAAHLGGGEPEVGPEGVSRDVARELDVLQAKARYSAKVDGIEPEFTIDTSLQLKAARHPMLEHAVPVDVLLDPPNRVLLITGPNTGGKTVALKTAGLFALMAQAGLHCRRPSRSCRCSVRVFADIGDEQSIEASLSTFSSHIRNLVAMDRDLQMPTLVLLGREVGTGHGFPNEGGALATAIVQALSTSVARSSSRRRISMR